MCPPRNNHQAVQTHEPGPRRMALARHAFAESFLTVRSISHRCEFRFARVGCRQAFDRFAPPSAQAGLGVLRGWRFPLRAKISLVPLYTSRTCRLPPANAGEWWQVLGVAKPRTRCVEQAYRAIRTG